MVEWWNPVLLEVINKLVSMNFIRWVFEKTLLECSEGGGGGWERSLQSDKSEIAKG